MKNYIKLLFLIGFIYVVVGILFQVFRLEIGPITGSIMLIVGLLLIVFTLLMFLKDKLKK
jgi:hypothetical protein